MLIQGNVNSQLEQKKLQFMNLGSYTVARDVLKTDYQEIKRITQCTMSTMYNVNQCAINQASFKQLQSNHIIKLK